MAIDFSKTGGSAGSNKASTSKTSSTDKKDLLNLDLGSLRAGGGVNKSHRKFFTEQLALLLETGNTLHGSLEILGSQTDHAPLQELIDDLHEKVTKGSTFSQALKPHKSIFSQTYITLVDAGEQGGYLPRVLTHLLEMEEKREELRSMVSSAFFYPVMLIIFSILVVVFVLTSIFPKFLPMFSSSGTELPASTRILMTSSDLFLNYWWVLIIAVVGLGVYIKMLLSQPAMRAEFDQKMLTLPIIGGMTARLHLTHMMRLLHLSLQNGVSLIDALKVSKDASGNIHFQDFVEDLITNVSEGKGLGIGFRKSKFIPHLIKQMIQTGEESGKLDVVTGRVADYYQKELARKLALMSKIIEPVMLLGMGVFIAFIVSALILPIFQISSAVN